MYKQTQQQNGNVQTNATAKRQCINKCNNKSAMYEQKQQQNGNVQTNATAKRQCTNKNNNKSAMYEQKQQQNGNVQTKATAKRQCTNKSNNKPAMNKEKQQQTGNVHTCTKQQQNHAIQILGKIHASSLIDLTALPLEFGQLLQVFGYYSCTYKCFVSPM